MSAQVETRLVRGNRGATIHLRDCKRATGKTWPWVWAEGRSDNEWVVKADLHPCRVCLPELAQLQDELREHAVVVAAARASREAGAQSKTSTPGGRGA